MPIVIAIVSAIATLAAVSRVSGGGDWTVEPLVGAFLMDDGERDPHDSDLQFDDQGPAGLLGARSLVTVATGWEIGFEYDYTTFESIMRHQNEPSFFERSDVEAHAIVAQVRHAWPWGPVEVLGHAGAGVIHIDAREFESERSVRSLAPADVAPADPQRDSESIAVVGVGIRRAVAERMALQLDARDLVHNCRTSPNPSDSSSMFCAADRFLHHLQLAASLRVEL